MNVPLIEFLFLRTKTFKGHTQESEIWNMSCRKKSRKCSHFYLHIMSSFIVPDFEDDLVKLFQLNKQGSFKISITYFNNVAI